MVFERPNSPHVFFPSTLFPQGLVCSRKDCFTGQSPGLWKGGWRRPSPSQISLGGGWQAAGAGGVEGCLGEPHWNGWSNLGRAGWPRMLAWQLD